jgi:hypothetical protein
MGGASATNSTSEFATTKSITGVPRDEANLEAEGGETVYGDLNGDGMPEQNTIKGPRHSEGGVPLNLPEGTFIFSDTKSMRIKDCEILEMFNKPCGKKSYTPATLAKVFDLNAYREILQDPNSDKLDVRTAERMLKNYTIKLGALALAQEAMKGFPQGIPAVAQPYIEAAGLSPEEILPPKEMTQLVDQLKQDQEAKQQPQPGPGGNPEMMQKAQQMNQGEPIAMPTDPQGAMTQDPMAQQQMMSPEMQQPQEMLGQPMPGMMPPQEQMMMFGGNYSNLNKFIDGGEEMMMQEQQAMQQQGPPQAQGGQDELMQIMQGVAQALEQGAEPAEIMAQLVQSEVPPEIIVQVFTQVGMPEEEVMQNLQMIMQQMQGAQPAQEQQMMPPQPQQGMPMAGKGIQLSKRDARRMSKGKLVNMLNYLTKYNQPHDSQVYGFSEINTNTENGDVDRNFMNTGVVANTFPDSTSNIQYRGSQDGKQYTYNTDDDFAYYDGKKVDVRPELNESIAGMVGYTPEQQFGGTPMAAYGMQLGGYDMPFVMANGGAAQYSNGGAKQKVKIIQEPLMRADNGKVVIDRSDYSTDAEYNRAIYDAKKKDPNVKIYNNDGKYLSSAKLQDPTFDKSWDPTGEWAMMYGSEDPDNPGTYIMNDKQAAIAAKEYMFEERLKDPTTRKMYIEGLDEASQNASNFKSYTRDKVAQKFLGDSSKTWADLTEDQKLNALRDQSRQASRIQAKGIDTRIFTNDANSFDTWANLEAKGVTNIINPNTGEPVTNQAELDEVNRIYEEELGVTDGSLHKLKGNDDVLLQAGNKTGNALMQQLAYVGFQNTRKKALAGDYSADPDQDYASSFFLPFTRGRADETTNVDPSGMTTPVDGYEGNTDFGQLATMYGPTYLFEGEDEEEEEEECNCKDGQVAKVVDGECICEEERITELPPKEPAQWWLQDTVNTFGIAGDRGYLEKDLPYDPGVDIVAPLGRYKDPTKELADNQAMFNIGADTAAQFAGVQGLTSRTSQMAGNAALQATKINQRYNNENINLANTIERGAAEAYNKQSVADREVEKGIYDATALANANFNKERLGFRLARRNQFNTAVTNKWKTDAMNQIYPDYAVDPSVGGQMAHTPNYRNPNPNSSSVTYASLLKQYKDQGMSDADAAKNAMNDFNSQRGNVASTGSTGSQGMINAIYGNRSAGSYNTGRSKFGGATGYYVLGGNVYPF